MRRSSALACLLGMAGLLIAAGNALADVHYSYEWEPNPTVIHSDPVFLPMAMPVGAPHPWPPPDWGKGAITMTDPPMQHADGSTNVIAAYLSTHSETPSWIKAHFTDAPYSLRLFLRDDENGKSGYLVFTGLLNGTLWNQGAKITNQFTGQTTKSLILGLDVFTVKIGPDVPPGGPGSRHPGEIEATITEHFLEPPPVVLPMLGSAPVFAAARISDPQDTPEPSTMLLMGVGSAFVGVMGWNRRRSARLV
jgi:PEP-CTERM motif